MAVYRVEVVESLVRTIFVEAHTATDAKEHVEGLYFDEAVVLDSDDFSSYSVEVNPVPVEDVEADYVVEDTVDV